MSSRSLTISVVVPALNEEAFIERCLRSVRDQGVPCELIVVDGGSRDRTAEVARRYADRVLSAPGSSIGEARWIGVREAKGEIIVSTDADTLHPPGWLGRLTRHFRDPSVVAAGGPVYPLDPSPSAAALAYTSGLNAAASALRLFVGSNMAFRKSAFERAGGYPLLIRGEDWSLSARLAGYGRTVYEPEAYVWTDVPAGRQAEFAAIAASAGLVPLGAALGEPFLPGLGAGFLAAEAATAFAEWPDDRIHHSQLAVAGLALLAVSRGHADPRLWRLLLGAFDGVLLQHLVTEDVRDPAWLHVNGALMTGATLVLLAG